MEVEVRIEDDAKGVYLVLSITSAKEITLPFRPKYLRGVYSDDRRALEDSVPTCKVLAEAVVSDIKTAAELAEEVLALVRGGKGRESEAVRNSETIKALLKEHLKEYLK